MIWSQTGCAFKGKEKGGNWLMLCRRGLPLAGPDIGALRGRGGGVAWSLPEGTRPMEKE
jgi:hypothetical protein